MYMFRAISCSSSGGQIVLIQHLVSSLSVSDHRVQKCAPEGHLLTVTIPDAVLIQFDLLRMSKILLETCTCRGSSSSSVGATARCGLWPVEQYLSICPYLSPTLSIFSLPTLLLLLSFFQVVIWVVHSM